MVHESKHIVIMHGFHIQGFPLSSMPEYNLRHAHTDTIDSQSGDMANIGQWTKPRLTFVAEPCPFVFNSAKRV
jgi:hypothetical protein